MFLANEKTSFHHLVQQVCFNLRKDTLTFCVHITMKRIIWMKSKVIFIIQRLQESLYIFNCQDLNALKEVKQHWIQPKRLLLSLWNLSTLLAASPFPSHSRRCRSRSLIRHHAWQDTITGILRLSISADDWWSDRETSNIQTGGIKRGHHLCKRTRRCVGYNFRCRCILKVDRWRTSEVSFQRV